MKLSTNALLALLAAALTVSYCPTTVQAAGRLLGAQEPTLAEPYQSLERYGDSLDSPDNANGFLGPEGFGESETSDAAEAPAIKPAPAKVPTPAHDYLTPRPDAGQLTPQSASEACCETEDCQACCDEDWCACRPTWSFRADGLVLNRNRPDSRRLVSAGVGGAELLNASDLKFEHEPGFRFGFSRRLGAQWDVDVVYFQADDFDATDTVLGSGLKAFGAPNLTAFTTGGMNFRYQSRLHSTEVNLKRHLRPGLAVMAGFRWIELGEDLTGSFVAASATAPFWVTDVNNHMYGFQLGTEMKIWDRGGPLTILGTGKAGVYYNDTDQTALLPTFPSALAARENQTSFVGEIEFMAVYQLSRHVALRGGYQMLWLGSVALAPEQIDSTDFGLGVAAVNTGGNAFYQGFAGGVEVSW